MQLTVTPDGPLEWLALKANLVPIPLLHVQIMPVIAKAVMEAADAGVFDALVGGAHTIEDVANTCQLHRKPTRELLGLLAALGYVAYRSGKYKPTRLTRKWTLKDNPESVYGMMVFNNRVMWAWLDKMGQYLKTGKGVQYHDNLTSDEWQYYQVAMLAAAGTEAREFARKAPVPNWAKTMLDIGGSHGQHSVALCRRIATLSSTILDLPEAIEKAAPLLDKMGLGDRVKHVAGNALADDFGKDKYDVVLMSSLAHHFTDPQNRYVTDKVARALRSGGVFIVNEFIRPDPDADPELVGSSTDLFYGLTSTAGNYSVKEIQEWMTVVGLQPLKVISYRNVPGRFQVAGRKMSG